MSMGTCIVDLSGRTTVQPRDANKAQQDITISVFRLWQHATWRSICYQMRDKEGGLHNEKETFWAMILVLF